MGRTAKYNLPYPENTDKANVPQDLKNLAEQTETALDKKVNTEDGKRLITNTEAEKLAGLSNYDDTGLKEQLTNQEKKIEELEEELETLYGDFEPNTVSGEVATITDGVKKSRVEVIGDGASYQETSEASINICPDTIEYWESGDYNNVSGGKDQYTSRIRLKELLKVTPSAEYYFNHNFVSTETVALNFVLRGYDKDKKYIENIGAVSNNSTKQISSNVEYIGIGLYNTKNLDNEVWETYQGIFESGALKPFICLNSETDKKYVPYSVNMPSTEFPSDIEVIEAYNKVDFSDKVYDGQNFYGVLHTYYDDGSFELDGTATSSSTHRISNIMNKPLKANTTYTIFVEFLSGSVDSNFSHIIQNTDTNTQIAGVSTNKSIVYQFTPTEDIENWCYGIYHGASKIFSKLKLRIMVVKGKFSNISDLLYLPYGHIGLVQRTDNILQNFDLDYEHAGMKVNIEKGYKFKVKGTSTAGWVNLHPAKEMKLPKGTILTFSAKNVEKPLYVYAHIDFADGTNDNYVQIGSPKKTITLAKDMKSYYLYLSNIPTNIATEYEFEIQMQYGENATEIVEPKQNLIPINLNGNTLAKVGDIKDLLNIGLDGSVSIKKNTNEYIFTGKENYGLGKNGKGLYYIPCGVSFTDNNSKIAYMNYLKHNENMWNVAEKEDIFKFSDNNLALLNLMTVEHDTAEGLKAWLQEKYNNGVPMKILYSANARTIQLPSISPIKLFEGTNNFELVTNLDTTLAVNYRISNNKRLKALESAILSLGGI